MKINYLKINGFGKLENKEIKLNNNINLIYGKNESGKTTLLKFITSMFYGLSKNKNGKELADYEKYTPWKATEFSGKVGYTLDDNKSFEVFRDFNKKNPQILNDKKEDISKEFNIDKTRGNEFFYEQTKIDEPLIYTTSIVEQQNVVLDEKDKTLLTQKVANLLSTGDDNISYKKSIDKLNKRLIEEVGTDRTIGRPINIVNEKINNINKELEILKTYIDKKEEIELNKKELKNKYTEIENNLEIIKEIKKTKEENNLEEEKIKIKNNIKEEYNEKINNLNNKLKINKIEENKNNNKLDIINLIFIPILIILNILINIFNLNVFINYAVVSVTIIYLLFNLNIFIKNKIKLNKINNNKKEEKIEIKKELNILEENINNLNKEIKNIEEELNNKLNKNKLIIINKYKENKINNINNLFNNNLEELNNILNNELNKYNEIKLEINTSELEEKEINNKLELKSKYIEELDYLNQSKSEILKLEKEINIVKDTLETAYTNMKDQITPKFTATLSNIIEKISEGEYKNIRFNEEEGLKVEKENGEYINANRLSLGTIDQLYLSLRLSALNEISVERVPIILDESFVYYDVERLKNILKYLNEEYKDYQIIILSCSEREKNVMNSLRIQYNLIEI